MRRMPPHVAGGELEGRHPFCCNFPLCVCALKQVKRCTLLADECHGLYSRHDGRPGFVACMVGGHSAAVVGRVGRTVEANRKTVVIGPHSSFFSSGSRAGPCMACGFVVMKQAASSQFSSVSKSSLHTKQVSRRECRVWSGNHYF